MSGALWLPLARGCLRPWRATDVESLARHADDEAVWRGLLDEFPHPYTLDDARQWIEHGSRAPGTIAFAVEIDGEAAGGIGLRLGAGSFRHSGELGYWLGRAYWGQGIMTQAVGAICDYAWRELGLARVASGVFDFNGASMRVLEKNGFVREGVLRAGVVKAGRLVDQVVYARLRDEHSGRPAV